MHPCISSAVCFSVVALAALPAGAQNQAWIQQLGGIDDDLALAAAPDGAGGVYMTGFTGNALGGSYAGLGDAWVARYGNAGNLVWVRQVGSAFMDFTNAAASDGSGGVYLLGGKQVGNAQLFLTRYDGGGNQLWFREFGTPGFDYPWGAAPDASGGVYVCGITTGSLGGPHAGTYDAWLARYDGAGTQMWIRQFGTSAIEHPRAAVPDGSGGVYVCGDTNGNLGAPSAGGYDVWIAHYDAAGNQAWIRQVGSSADDCVSEAEPGNSNDVYVGGYSFGSLGGPNAGGADSWLGCFDSAGNQTSSRQLGTNLDDVITGLAPDALGGVFVAGCTAGSLGGPSAGNIDAWAGHYDGAGNLSWLRQLGGTDRDFVWAAVPDGSGGFFACGETWSSLGGPNAGDCDAWLVHYEPCAIPATYCAAKVNSAGCVPSISWTGTASSTGPIDDFHIRATNVLNQKAGLMLWSTLPAATPFGGGILCLSTPIHRTPGQQSGGSPAPAVDCTGQYAFHFGNAYVQSHALAAGQTIHAQYWSRDPGFVAPNNMGLSNALSFVICQ